MLNKAILIAQFTDLHIVRHGALVLGRVDTAARLNACIDTLEALNPRPDLLLLTGDLVDNGQAEEYAHLRELFAAVAIPMFVMPGNHDLRAPLREAFHDHAYLGTAGPINYVVERNGLRIVLLDSVVDGEYWGELAPQTMAWFASRLSESPRTPTLVAVHHPPIPYGEAGMDGIGMRNTEAFGRTIEANPQIVAVISGHYHRAITARWRGTNAVVAPATAQTMLLDFAPAAGPFYRLEPPAFCLHRWDGAMFWSHVIQAGEYPGPYQYD